MTVTGYVVDCFAGGGGASLGIERAIGRPVDFAINHDREAIAMHMANHPDTKHFQNDIWKVKPRQVVGHHPVALAWFSPDCKHFSKAKGGKPVEKSVRDLAWVVIEWAREVRPAVIMLENVEEFRTWGPLGDDNLPIRDRKGETFNEWQDQLRTLGYEVEWRELKACDYGAPTIRKRLFIIARCDGEPIRWPEKTHADPKKPNPVLPLLPYRTAAECIDWSVRCPSIFERSKPLADATMRRIANGIKRYVIDAAEPFIVNLTHGGRLESTAEPFATITGAHRGEKAVVAPYIAGVGGRAGQSPERSADTPMGTATAKADSALVTPFLASITHNKSGGMISGGDAPVPTLTTSKGGEQALIAPTLVQTGYGEREGQSPRSLDIEAPLGTVVGGGAKHAMAAAFLAKHFVGHETPGADLEDPAPTVTATDHNGLVAAHVTKFSENSTGHLPDEPLHTAMAGAPRHGVVTSNLVKLYGTADAAPVDDPMPTVTSGGNHLAEVRAFLVAYFGNERDGQAVTDPFRTVTSKERFGLVYIHGEPYEIVDIGMRMLMPRELARAQGFPDGYILAPVLDGKPLTKTAQIRMIGNSVCPDAAAALVTANVGRVGQQAMWAGHELAAVGGGS